MTAHYAGPPRWQLDELMEKQRHAHDEAMYRAWEARFYSRRTDHVVALRSAALVRLGLRYLLACQRACQRALDNGKTRETV